MPCGVRVPCLQADLEALHDFFAFETLGVDPDTTWTVDWYRILEEDRIIARFRPRDVNVVPFDINAEPDCFYKPGTTRRRPGDMDAAGDDEQPASSESEVLTDPESCSESDPQGNGFEESDSVPEQDRLCILILVVWGEGGAEGEGWA